MGPIRKGLAKQNDRRNHPSAHNPHAKSLGKRGNGTEKGLGFLGPVDNPKGGVSTELSMGVNFGGREELVPLMVPTLTQGELGQLLGAKNIGEVPGPIKRKAIDHALERKRAGKPMFFD